MQMGVFPRTGQPISRLGFGAMGVGGNMGTYDDDYLIRSMLLSLENGVTLIDTARAYGRSEELVGKALREWKGERPFIASKVMPQPAPAEYPAGSGWQHPVPVHISYPKGSIRSSVEESLRQLGIECLDLIQMHQFWAQWEDDIYWLEELQQLKQEGKVKNIGISVPDHRHDLAISIVRSGLIDSIQTIVNIFDPTALDSLVPVCKANQVAVIARVVLDEGGLTGFLTKDTVIPPKDFQRNYFDCLPRSIYLDKVEALRQFIPSSAESLTELAIRFVLQDPGITSAIISMHIHEYALENIQAASKPKLDDEVFEIMRQRHRWIRNFFQARRFV